MMHYKGLAKLAAKEAKNRALLICETAGMLSLLGEKWAYSAQVESLQQSDGRELLAVEDGRLGERFVTESPGAFPVFRVSYGPEAAPDLAIIAYGGMAGEALEAARRLMLEEELMADVVVPTQIAPLDHGELVDQLRGCRRVVTLEEGTLRAGWGAEVVAGCAACPGERRYLRIAAADCPLPTNLELERRLLPSAEGAYQRIKEWMAT